jgi:hypothetical protein
VKCGEVSGTISILRDGRATPVGGVTLEMREIASRRIVHTARTAYDGFYDFAGVRPGRYVLALEAGAEVRLGVRPISFVFVIRPDGTVLDAADLVLEPEPRTAAATGPEADSK